MKEQEQQITLCMNERDDYEDDIAADKAWRRRFRPIRCADGFCGAEDCPTCRATYPSPYGKPDDAEKEDEE